MAGKPNKSHHLVYFDSSVDDYISTTPKDWARAHQSHFAPKYTFEDSDATPTVDAINRILKDQYGFVEFTYPNRTVLCNFDTRLKFSN